MFKGNVELLKKIEILFITYQIKIKQILGCLNVNVNGIKDLINFYRNSILVYLPLTIKGLVFVNYSVTHISGHCLLFDYFISCVFFQQSKTN